MESEVSPQLLVNIFQANTPLHDGAVIIRNNKIAAAACVLPLSDEKLTSKKIGTRHRAGMGITSETDSIVIVVSEERGTISVCKDGKITMDLGEEALKKFLINNLVPKTSKDNRKKK